MEAPAFSVFKRPRSRSTQLDPPNTSKRKYDQSINSSTTSDRPRIEHPMAGQTAARPIEIIDLVRDDVPLQLCKASSMAHGRTDTTLSRAADLISPAPVDTQHEYHDHQSLHTQSGHYPNGIPGHQPDQYAEPQQQSRPCLLHLLDPQHHNNPQQYQQFPQPQPPTQYKSYVPQDQILHHHQIHQQSALSPLTTSAASYKLDQHTVTPSILGRENLEAPPSQREDQTDDIVPIIEPILCPEQAELVEIILSGRNVFYTGSAGCGKSTVLKAFVKRFAERGIKVDIIAPTGRAALDINGSTTWTYAGWTPDSHKKTLKQLTDAAHGKFVSARLRGTGVLVIDEISMVENLHFERLNAVMKAARGNREAFGGVQLVVTGDFCQLPPVKPFGHCIECGRELMKNRESTEYKCRMHGTYFDIDKWAFRSKAWAECDFAHVNLTQIHRQSDKVFIDILNKLRMGILLKQESIDLLLHHQSETRNAVQLFATRREVQMVNEQRFTALRTKARVYPSVDNFRWNEKHGNLRSKGERGLDGSLNCLREHRYESQIQLKKGMLVVLLHNLELGAGLVNGTQGTIQGFEDYAASKMPTAATGRRERDGATIPGLSTLTGDHASFKEREIRKFAEQMPFKGWPIVRFLNGVERTIYPDCTVNEIGDEAPSSLLSRTQIPLMAAWAMTTHKSQGMTLNRVVVNLEKSFEQGQAYVALSRARSLEGLKVESFPPSAQGKGNPQVKQFLKEKFGIE